MGLQRNTNPNNLPVELKQQLMTLDNPMVRLELVGDLLERSGWA